MKMLEGRLIDVFFLLELVFFHSEVTFSLDVLPPSAFNLAKKDQAPINLGFPKVGQSLILLVQRLLKHPNSLMQKMV
ncbi:MULTISPECIES: hypothetical protein [Bacillus]|nr:MULTISPECIES: hypothetical protein [Bacillus]AJO57819.1 hypothetical protein QF06_04925 [Bacillus sp. YP1]MCM3058378.1 hypothetical protein [Bacillus subtilis]BET55686.1 hypothetical protein BsubNA05_27920 [Bacillus subtilis]